MRIGMVLTPLDSGTLRLASQIGVSDVVARCTGPTVDAVGELKRRVEAANLTLSVIEGGLPLPSIVLGRPDRDDAIAFVQTLIRSMGAVGVPILCYNFMSTGDMTRTRYDVVGRGGATVNQFSVADYNETGDSDEPPRDPPQLWANLERFLHAVLPVAEEAGVALAMHPDDPPGLERLNGQPRIMGSVEDFERLAAIDDRPANGICFCQGCFSEMGTDVAAAVHRLGPRIRYVHFRDVAGCTPEFRETFHDCGQTDMAAAMRAYRDIGFDGVMRPDHVPVMEGETGDASGYTMQGRLFAVGYMRGLMHAVETETHS